MAEKQLSRIGNEVTRQWPGARAAVVHRIGSLLPGELAVVIAVAAPHRAEAFDACRHVIERLKQDVPIWKKEFSEDGDVWVGVGS
jgi:molybdopterin synthase catalytic subunit